MNVILNDFIQRSENPEAIFLFKQMQAKHGSNKTNKIEKGDMSGFE